MTDKLNDQEAEECVRKLLAHLGDDPEREGLLDTPRRVLGAMAAIAILTTIGIVLSLIFETFSFFSKIGWRIDKFLFGTN